MIIFISPNFIVIHVHVSIAILYLNYCTLLNTQLATQSECNSYITPTTHVYTNKYNWPVVTPEVEFQHVATIKKCCFESIDTLPCSQMLTRVLKVLSTSSSTLSLSLFLCLASRHSPPWDTPSFATRNCLQIFNNKWQHFIIQSYYHTHEQGYTQMYN